MQSSGAQTRPHPALAWLSDPWDDVGMILLLPRRGSPVRRQGVSAASRTCLQTRTWISVRSQDGRIRGGDDRFSSTQILLVDSRPFPFESAIREMLDVDAAWGSASSRWQPQRPVCEMCRDETKQIHGSLTLESQATYLGMKGADGTGVTAARNLALRADLPAVVGLSCSSAV